MQSRVFVRSARRTAFFAFFSFCFGSGVGVGGCFYNLPEGASLDIRPRVSALSDWPAHLDRLLRTYVDGEGRVDYQGLQKEQAVVEGCLAAMAATKTEGWGDTAILAFWISAYNLAMWWNVLSKLPSLTKISDFDALFFKQRRFFLAGAFWTLDQIEHSILRRSPAIPGVSVSVLRPEIHVALSCAAVSCPPLLSSLWQASTIDTALQERMKRVFTDPRFARLSPDGKPQVTRLVDWFFDDFQPSGQTVGDYLASLVSEPKLQSALRAAGSDKAKFLFFEYDWTLNRKPSP